MELRSRDSSHEHTTAFQRTGRATFVHAKPGGVLSAKGGATWLTQYPPAATRLPAPTNAPTAVTSSMSTRPSTFHRARRAPTASGRHSAGETASTTRTRTARAKARATTRRRLAMAKDHGSSVKNDKQYEGL